MLKQQGASKLDRSRLAAFSRHAEKLTVGVTSPHSEILFDLNYFQAWFCAKRKSNVSGTPQQSVRAEEASRLRAPAAS